MDFKLNLSDSEVALTQMLIQKGAEALLNKVATQCNEQAQEAAAEPSTEA